MAKRRKHKKTQTAMFSCRTRINSIMESIGVAVTPCYTTYAEFCKETTLHGLKHTVEPSLHWIERVLWLILTVSAFVGAVYCGLSQLSRYNSEPVVVSLQRDHRAWRTAFPSVTACYIERVEPEKAQEAIFRHWNVTEESDPDKYQYYYEFIELVADVSFRENIQNFWKYQSDDTVEGIDLIQLAYDVHPANELELMTSHVDEEVVWYPVMTEVGMCLTLNSQYAEYQHMLDKEWRPKQLFTCHYHSGQCYVRIDSSNKAVRYFIHSPYEISTAISNPTGEVELGQELVIDYKAIEIQASPSVRKLRPEQRRCRYHDEWIGNFIRAYSFGLCQMQCRSRLAMMFCGCRPYFNVKGASLGGTTALFVGASALTVIETVLFILRHIVGFIIDKIFGCTFKLQYNP